jgi:hypothetical protein
MLHIDPSEFVEHLLVCLSECELLGGGEADVFS